MNTYKVQYKNSPETNAMVYGVEASTKNEALFKAAKQLGLDTDPCTQTYTLLLEAIEQTINPGLNISLNPSVQSIVDEIGSIDREIARLKAQRDDLAAIVKLTGAGRYFGQYFEGLVYESKGRTTTNWKAIAEHFEPSRQLITAHTTTGEPSLSLKVELLKVTA